MADASTLDPGEHKVIHYLQVKAMASHGIHRQYVDPTGEGFWSMLDLASRGVRNALSVLSDEGWIKPLDGGRYRLLKQCNCLLQAKYKRRLLKRDFIPEECISLAPPAQAGIPSVLTVSGEALDLSLGVGGVGGGGISPRPRLTAVATDEGYAEFGGRIVRKARGWRDTPVERWSSWHLFGYWQAMVIERMAPASDRWNKPAQLANFKYMMTVEGLAPPVIKTMIDVFTNNSSGESVPGAWKKFFAARAKLHERTTHNSVAGSEWDRTRGGIFR